MPSYLVLYFALHPQKVHEVRMEEKIIEKLDGLGKQICDVHVVERVRKLELNDSSQKNDACEENLNENTGEN